MTSRSPSVSQCVNTDGHGPKFTRPLGAAQPVEPVPQPERRYRHGPCIRCGAPVTVRRDSQLPLMCLDCEDRGRARLLAGLILLALGVVVAGLAWYAQAVTP
jgi:hypothetical protein